MSRSSVRHSRTTKFDRMFLVGQLGIPTVGRRLELVWHAVVLASAPLAPLADGDDSELDPTVAAAAHKALVDVTEHLEWIERALADVLDLDAPTTDQSEALEQLIQRVPATTKGTPTTSQVR